MKMEIKRRICTRCNNIKRNYQPEDLRMVANWIDVRRQKSAWGNESEQEAA